MNNISRSFFLISLLTVLSRVLGFVRDIVIAKVFGIGIVSDAFFIAFKLPNFFRRIFAEGAFLQAFLPVLVEYKRNEKDVYVRSFISYIFGLLIFLLIPFIFLGILFAPVLVKVFVPGFINVQEKFILVVDLVRVIFPYVFFVSLSSFMGAVLNTCDIFAFPAFIPIILNISMIFFSIFVSSFFEPPIMALAWSVIVGGIIQLVFSFIFLKRTGMLIVPRLNFYDFGVNRVLKSISVVIVSMFSSQVSFIINTIFASFLISGSISWMYYADRLMELPAGILGVSLGTILLPLLSRSFSNNNMNEYSILMDWGLRLCFLLSLPSAVLLSVLSKPLVMLLFQYNGFSFNDMLMIQYSLIAYSVGLVGFVLVKVLLSAFYSSHNVIIPARVSFIVLIFTQIMNIIFVGSLKHVGLSLAIGLGACFNAGLLYWYLRESGLFIPRPGWLKFFLQVFFAVSMMLIILIFFGVFLIDWNYSNMLYFLLRLVGVICIGIITYFLSLFMCGIKLKHLIYPKIL